MKILALHGFRTSGEILSMQTGAFRYHLGLDLFCVNAPHLASGPCDPMVEQIYASYVKYEWFARSDIDNNKAIAMKDTSLKYLLKLISEKEEGFEGILGFSQGAAMATVLLEHYRSNDLPCPFKFAIMIAGVEPKIFYPELKINIRSLHLIGQHDEFSIRSSELASWYENNTVVFFNESHNIPSVRTQIYPVVQDWLNTCK